MITKSISIETAKADLDALVGMPISRVWRGYGTATFFELGELRSEPKTYNPEKTSLNGDVSMHIINWQIKKRKKLIMNALYTDYAIIDKVILSLIGLKIIGIRFQEGANAMKSKITIDLDSGVTIQVKNSPWEFFELRYYTGDCLIFDKDGSIRYMYRITK